MGVDFVSETDVTSSSSVRRQNLGFVLGGNDTPAKIECVIAGNSTRVKREESSENWGINLEKTYPYGFIHLSDPILRRIESLFLNFDDRDDFIYDEKNDCFNTEKRPKLKIDFKLSRRPGPTHKRHHFVLRKTIIV